MHAICDILDPEYSIYIQRMLLPKKMPKNGNIMSAQSLAWLETPYCVLLPPPWQDSRSSLLWIFQ